MFAGSLKTVWDNAMGRAGGLCKGAWDRVTLDSVRLKRGMEKTSPNVLAPFIAYGAGVLLVPSYQLGGMKGLADMAFGLAAAWVGVVAARTRLEIKTHDMEERNDGLRASLPSRKGGGSGRPFIVHRRP